MFRKLCGSKTDTSKSSDIWLRAATWFSRKQEKHLPTQEMEAAWALLLLFQTTVKRNSDGSSTTPAARRASSSRSPVRWTGSGLVLVESCCRPTSAIWQRKSKSRSVGMVRVILCSMPIRVILVLLNRAWVWMAPVATKCGVWLITPRFAVYGRLFDYYSFLYLASVTSLPLPSLPFGGEGGRELEFGASCLVNNRVFCTIGKWKKMNITTCGTMFYEWNTLIWVIC